MDKIRFLMGLWATFAAIVALGAVLTLVVGFTSWTYGPDKMFCATTNAHGEWAYELGALLVAIIPLVVLVWFLVLQTMQAAKTKKAFKGKRRIK